MRRLRVLLWDDPALTDIEVTALEELAKVVNDLHQRGCETWVAAIVSDQQAMLERFGTGVVRFFDSVEEALTAFHAIEAS